MATILAHIQIKEGRERDFEAVVRGLHEATLQRESAVRHYEYWRGATPSLYYCLLAFEDFNAFIEHQTSDHHETASPKLADLIAEMKLEWVDPVAGASRLPPTNMQPLPDGSNELSQRYHRIFAATIQDWWLAIRDGRS
jgi:quinol monooxygenase YgiN